MSFQKKEGLAQPHTLTFLFLLKAHIPPNPATPRGPPTRKSAFCASGALQTPLGGAEAKRTVSGGKLPRTALLRDTNRPDSTSRNWGHGQHSGHGQDSCRLHFQRSMGRGHAVDDTEQTVSGAASRCPSYSDHLWTTLKMWTQTQLQRGPQDRLNYSQGTFVMEKQKDASELFCSEIQLKVL